MRAILTALLLGPSIALAQAPAPAPANPKATPSSKVETHRKDDVARHRQIAKAHEEAARCLEAGTAEKQCQEKLRDSCKGIAVGQYCGMRHAH